MKIGRGRCKIAMNEWAENERYILIQAESCKQKATNDIVLRELISFARGRPETRRTEATSTLFVLSISIICTHAIAVQR